MTRNHQIVELNSDETEIVGGGIPFIALPLVVVHIPLPTSDSAAKSAE